MGKLASELTNEELLERYKTAQERKKDIYIQIKDLENEIDKRTGRETFLKGEFTNECI